MFALRLDLVREAAEVLEASNQLVEDAIARLAKVEQVFVENEAVYRMPFYYAEIGVANRLKDLVANPRSRLEEFRALDWSTAESTPAENN